MIHAYSLYRSQHACYSYKQCRALSKKTFRYNPIAHIKELPYIRRLVLKGFHLSKTSYWQDYWRVQWLIGTPIERSEILHGVKTLKDLSDRLPSLLFSSSSLKVEGRIRARLLKTFTKLIWESKPMQAKTFNTFNYAYELPHFTRIFTAYRCNGHPLPPMLGFHGFKAAACGNSPAAMKHYLSLVGLRPSGECLSLGLNADQWDMIVKCILVTTRTQSSQSEKRLYQKKAWAEVVTYRRDFVVPEMSSGKEMTLNTSAICMYHVLIIFGVHGMSNYFRLVSRFCDSQAVFEWGMDWLVHGLYDRNLPPETLNFVFNSCIQTLLAKKSPEKAWELAQKALPNFGTIQDKTWKLLFRHPEFLAEWKPEMKGPVMDALKIYMSKAERQLGVKWTGGEDGFHLPRGAEYGPQ
ncbi:hypothetical protein MMC29_001369 [Sticta canariensis]|nr:hypothetical protein [Sticta canariensis]